VTVPVVVPVARARAVAVTQAAVTVPAALLPAATTVPLAAVVTAFTVGAALVATLATLLPAALTVGATLVAALATLLPAALTVGARLVARPVTLLAAAFAVGATRVAAPDALLAAALSVGAALVAAPVIVVAAELVVAVALELLHAARRGSAPSRSSAQNRPVFHRDPVISYSFVRLSICRVSHNHPRICMTDANSVCASDARSSADPPATRYRRRYAGAGVGRRVMRY